MGRVVQALRYAALEGELTAEVTADVLSQEDAVFAFRAGVTETIRMSDDETEPLGEGRAASNDARALHPANDAGPPAPTKATRDGSKSAAKLEARMRRRAERLALDAVRHQELVDNRELRKARSLSRRWFVLGRALDAAMAENAEFAAALRAALDRYVARPDERALLGWAEAPETP